MVCWDKVEVKSENEQWNNDVNYRTKITNGEPYSRGWLFEFGADLPEARKPGTEVGRREGSPILWYKDYVHSRIPDTS